MIQSFAATQSIVSPAWIINVWTMFEPHSVHCRSSACSGSLATRSFVNWFLVLCLPIYGAGKRIDNTSVRDEPYEFVLGGEQVRPARSGVTGGNGV